jgi:hypothetical protein
MIDKLMVFCKFLLKRYTNYKRKNQIGWTLYASVENDFDGEIKEYPLDWIIQIKESYFDSLFEDGEEDEDLLSILSKLNVRLIESKLQIDHMSEICFYYAARDLFLDKGQSVIIFRDLTTEMLKVINDEMVPHYKEVKQFFVEGEFKEIQLSVLKEESEEIAKNLFAKEVYPVVNDLYKAPFTQSAGPGKLQFFSIKQESIIPFALKENDQFHQFILEKYFKKNKPLYIEPTGWKVQESLKDFIVIRYFCSFAEQIVLLINTTDDSVRGIYIFGKKKE